MGRGVTMRNRTMPDTMTDPIRLRLALPADADLVREISAAAYLPAYLAILGAAPRPAFEDPAPRIARAEVHLLERSGQVLGVLMLEPAADHLTIYSLAVRPSAQGTGLGRALLAFADGMAIEAGLREVRLYTNTRMSRNVALYRAAGFVESGVREHPSRPGEFLVDMAKRL